MMVDNSDSGISTLNNTMLTNVVFKSSYRHCDDVCLRFCHFNAANAVKRIDELNSIFDGVGFHFIGVSETWFKPKHTKKIFGYGLVRADRTDGRRGGGVALYINNDVRY
jgi:hypothetical protein